MFCHIVPTCICCCYCHTPTDVWSLHFLQSSHMYYDPHFPCDLYVGYLVCLTIEMFDHFCSSMFFFLDLSYVDTKLWDFKGQCKLLFNKLWYLVGLTFFFLGLSLWCWWWIWRTNLEKFLFFLLMFFFFLLQKLNFMQHFGPKWMNVCIFWTSMFNAFQY
jgi:hypothetical protein